MQKCFTMNGIPRLKVRKKYNRTLFEHSDIQLSYAFFGKGSLNTADWICNILIRTHVSRKIETKITVR